MFTKILSLVTIVALLIPTSSFATVQDYEIKIDTFMESMTDKQMQKLYARIDKIYESEVVLSQRDSEILSYLHSSLDARLLTSNTLSYDEKKAVIAEVMKIQQNISDGLQGQFDTFINLYARNSNIQESGDLSINVDIDHEKVWNVSAGLELKDYTAISSGFDAQIKTDVSAFLTLENSPEAGTFNVSAFMDYISKDGNLYVLLDDLKIDTDKVEEMKEFIDMLTKVAEQNGYVAAESDVNAQALELIAWFAPHLLLDDARAIFDQPLLRAHRKLGDKYILVPTKYACNQGKIITKKFDPFYGSDTCSDGQYKDLVEDFLSQEGYLYMTLGNTTTLWIQVDSEREKISGNVVFQNDHILSSYLNVTDGSSKIDFEYEIKSHISLDISDGDDDLNMSMLLGLDKQNYIHSWEMTMKLDNQYENMDMKLSLKNGNISWNMQYSTSEKKLFEMSMWGKYGPRTFTLNTDFEMFENPFESKWDIQYVDEEILGEECYENYYWEQKFVCYVEKKPSGKTITGSFSFASDMKYSRNNLDILLNVLLWNDQILRAELVNKSTQTFKQTQVLKPENTIPYEEVFPIQEYLEPSYEDDFFEQPAEDAVDAMEE